METKRAMIAVGSLGGLTFGCASAGKEWKARTGRLSAAGRDAIASGGHCESSALTNALRGAGWEVRESDIVGGGGAPSFMFSADGFPFLGTRSARMREAFFEAAAIPWRSVVPDSGREWEPVFKQLERGIPVPLRVDMRFLPYRYGGKIGPKRMEFGWHWITLFAVDFDGKTAFVSDTEHAELQEIGLAELDRARRSKTRVWPPRAEFVEIEPTFSRKPLDRQGLEASAIRALLANYEGREAWTAADSVAAAPLSLPTGMAGLEAFPDALRSFDRYAKPYLAGPALSFLGGCIERNGTGGAAFRVLFRDFAADPDASSAMRSLIPALESSIVAWRALAGELDLSGSKVNARMKADERQAAYRRCADAAEKVAAAERDLYETLKRLRSVPGPL